MSTTASWEQVGGARVLVLANEALRVVVAPHRGADVLSMRLRGQELLWRAPRSRRFSAPPDLLGGEEAETFYDSYPGGIQELFPNAGPAVRVDGCLLPLHGEACRLRWDAEIRLSPTGDSALVCETELARYPCTMRKSFSLDGGVLRVGMSVTNRSSRRLPAMWALHPAYGEALIGPRSRVYLDATGARSHPTPFGAAQRYAPGERVGLAGVERHGLALEGGDARTADLVYAEVAAGWYAVHNPDTGLALSASWPAELFGWVWLWQECHDDAGWPWFGEHHIVGVELHTSMPADGLGVAVENRTALWLEPRQTVSATVRLGVDDVGERLDASQLPDLAARRAAAGKDTP